MPREAQPVPPTFQPEVAAEAIVCAASHPRRELWVGRPTVRAIVADKVAPGFLDHSLARAADDAQQLDEPVSLNLPDNLVEGRSRRFRCPRPFDGTAKARSIQLWLSLRRGWLGGVAATALAAALAARRRA
jgi:hypothetical protein